jgi:hypothetical protein
MKAGWSWGVSAIDSEGRTIWIADAHRADSETARLWRSVVRAIFAQLMPTGGLSTKQELDWYSGKRRNAK